MTVKAKIRSDESYMEGITRRLEERKELTSEQKSYLKEIGIGEFVNPGFNKSNEIIGPTLEKALKRIELNLILSTNSLSDTLDVIKNIYLDYVKKVTFKKEYNWPSELRRHAHKLKYARLDFDDNDFFFGWILIQTAEFVKIMDRQGLFEVIVKGKKLVKHNWRVACDLMSRVSGISKYIKDYDSRKNRNSIYKHGMKNIKIVCRAYGLKLFLEGIYKVGEHLNESFSAPSQNILKAQKLYGYDSDLTKKIYSYLSDRHYKKGESVTKIGDIYNRFSNKRLEKDILPCLRFLERNGLILYLEKNKIDKKIYFLSKGKSLKDVLPFWINYNSIFDSKEFLKEFLA